MVEEAPALPWEKEEEPARERVLPSSPPPLKGRPTFSRAAGILDAMSQEEVAKVYIWLAERPRLDIDPVRLAMAHVNSLKEDELLRFFQELRESIDPELWEILTDV